MPRNPTTNANAEAAVAAFVADLETRSASINEAWLSVCRLLLTCRIWSDGRWKALHGQPVLRESNDYKMARTGAPNKALQEAQLMSDYIAAQMKIPRSDLESNIGQFLMSLGVQPNNPRGHAFRSIVGEILARYGDPNLVIEEAVDPYRLFPRSTFALRSAKPRIDMIIYRHQQIVALCSTRWTYRRVDILKEAANYIAAARLVNRRCRFFGITAEVNPARLRNVVSQTAPLHRNSVMEKLVHLHAPLATTVINHNHSLQYLWDLVEWVNDSPNWQ